MYVLSFWLTNDVTLAANVLGSIHTNSKHWAPSIFFSSYWPSSLNYRYVSRVPMISLLRFYLCSSPSYTIILCKLECDLLTKFDCQVLPIMWSLVGSNVQIFHFSNILRSFISRVETCCFGDVMVPYLPWASTEPEVVSYSVFCQ